MCVDSVVASHRPTISILWLKKEQQRVGGHGEAKPRELAKHNCLPCIAK